MTELLVADVGNSRIKWGRCTGREVIASASLPLNGESAWERQLAEWNAGPARWIIAGGNPPGIERLQRWIDARSSAVHVIADYQQLPIRIAVEYPERVGLDRLLNAVAANARARHGRPAVLVDAGSAVTVDLVDSLGVFQGGAIFPGSRLMAQALKTYTAKLPLVSITESPQVPGKSTEAAIAAGVHSAVVGGIERLARQLSVDRDRPMVYVTGGDASLIAQSLSFPIELWPLMTLEGLRIAAAGVTP